jgi:hypothetical protein
VASCITAAFGCTTEPPGVLRQTLTDSPLRRVPCGDLLLAADPIKPAQPIDYIGVYLPVPQGTALELLADYGEPCADASNQGACLASALAGPWNCAPDAIMCKPFAITRQDDEVLRHEHASTLVALLGAIDTHSEAVLVAQLHGLHTQCGFGTTDPTNPGTGVQATSAGYRVESKWNICSDSIGDQSIEISRDGTSTGLDKDTITRSGCAVGRRPAGLQPSAAAGNGQPLGAFLAECAHLEAASVPAFRRLTRELDRLGARRLASFALRSAREEVRHAALMRGLAARYGAHSIPPRIAAPQRLRSALEIALENAIEGCVRETFGALVAWQQSACAKDPLVARTMRGIAADETRHAELAWEVAAWLEPKLSARERLTVLRARRKAFEQLQKEIADDPLPDASRAQIGWPSNAQQHALLNRLAVELGVS